MENKNLWGWVVGIVVVVLLILGLWWVLSGPPATPAPGATTTPQVTSTTTPVAVQDRRTSTVASVIASISNAGTFEGLLASTGVSSSITGKGPYTVFVPTDGAFTRLAPGEISSMTSAEKKRLVQYHIVSGKLLDVDAVSSGRHMALSKDMLNFSVRLSDGTASVESGQVTAAYKASNGVVYVVSTVLLPPLPSGPGTQTN